MFQVTNIVEACVCYPDSIEFITKLDKREQVNLKLKNMSRIKSINFKNKMKNVHFYREKKKQNLYK